MACTKIAEVFVSTDSPAIADIAKRNGAKVPELRPAHLAEDATPTEDVMLQVAQDWLDWEPNTVMILLQPTSPYRRPGTIASAIELFEKQNADSKPGKLTIYTVFDEESDFQVKNKEIRRPEAKTQEKRTQTN